MIITLRHSDTTDSVKLYRIKPTPPDIALCKNAETLYAGMTSTDDSLASFWRVKHNGEVKAVAKSKKPCNLSLSTDSISIDENNLTQIVTATWQGNGSLSASSSNSSIISVSTSGNSVTLSGGLSTGLVSVAFTVSETADYEGQFIQLVGNIDSIAFKPLNECTPEEIQTIARSGKASSFWNVGDTTSEIPIQDTPLGTSTYSNSSSKTDYLGNGSYRAFIIGFDHNWEIEGKNTIHFCLGKTQKLVDIAFVETICYNAEYDGSKGNYSHCKGVFMHKQVNSAAGIVNISNSGGWYTSPIRNWLNSGLLARMDSSWTAVMTPATKYTAINNTTAEELTSDIFFIPSEYEIFGSISISDDSEAVNQAQYDYFRNGASTIRYKHNDTSTAAIWWTRSPTPTSSNSTNFCAINTAGRSYSRTGNYSQGVVPCFVIS